MQAKEVYLHADLRYGPDDPTLWPQPHLVEYPHLGSIPRKPVDVNDPLSIMWWDPTHDDFETFDGSIVDGLGELLKLKLLLFEALMKGLEDRVEEYKKGRDLLDLPNKFLLSMVKAMQDAYVCIASLKTSFTEMRFGITEFQRYFLEVAGCLDYLVLYKPHMDRIKPSATTVANCVGAVTNLPRVVQDFHNAGIPIWFLRPKKSWASPISCNILKVITPLIPADLVCVSEHDPPFPPIFHGTMTRYERHSAIHRYSRQWLAFKDPFGNKSTGS